MKSIHRRRPSRRCHGAKSSDSAIAPQLVPLTATELLRKAGIAYPETVDGWRWLYRMRAERGLDSAFRRVGRRVLVDTAAYLDAIRNSAQ